MGMAMEGYEGLLFCDEPLDRDAADMSVEGRMVNHFSCRIDRIKHRTIGWGMEQEYGVFYRGVFRQRLKIVCDGRIPHLIRGDRQGSASFFWRDRANINEATDVVALPVFEEEGRRRHVRVSSDITMFPGNRFFMDVRDDPFGICIKEEVFVDAWVVVSQDDEKPCRVPRYFLDMFYRREERVVDELIHR